MPPPQINRNLKPKRKLSDSLSVASNTEPSSPRPAPTVDRSCKPAINSQVYPIDFLIFVFKYF